MPVNQNEITNVIVNHAADSSTPFPGQVAGRPLTTQDFRVALVHANDAANRIRDEIARRDMAAQGLKALGEKL